ncbi:MAG: cytidylyltransferase domain-containing protein [Anaerolineales bacterium]
MEILALIPARGGSKGIPRKNIRPFAGYPLIAWSIAAAQQARSVTRIIVSTDDAEIADIAHQFGAEVPFLRPPELAQDQTPDWPVFEHALRWLAEHEGYQPEIVVHLRPTSPIRPPWCIDEAVRILLEHPDADCVRGVVPSGQNPFKMWRIDPQSGRMIPLLNLPDIAEPYNAPRQSLPPTYWQTGHIDAIRARTILEKRSMTGEVIYPLLLDPRYTVDIDTPTDWERYEQVVRHLDLEVVWPGRRPRPMPRKVSLLVLDFDGVLTDNRVWTDSEGREMVVSLRSDSLFLRELKANGIDVLVLSSEPNPVVQARARKLGLEAVHGVGIREKGSVLREILKARRILPEEVVYVGNDLNDLPCFEISGWAVAVADAWPEVRRAADYVLSRPGGQGAVREICEMLLKAIE